MTDRENPDMQQPGGLAAEAVQEARLAASAEAVAEGASAEAEDATALAGGGEERAQRGDADCEGGYNISHLVESRLESGCWFYLVEWAGYAVSER